MCAGNDSRLTDARTPLSHVHGNISNAGAIGSTADLPIKTGASGVLTAGAWGTTAGTFCRATTRGFRTRAPQRRKASHATGGSDALTAADIGAVGSASPAFTGTPTAPTGAVGTDTTQLATTAFVKAQIANDAILKSGGTMSGSLTVNGNNYFRFGANSSWGATLQVGGDGVNGITRSNMIASVVTTDGSLHLDSGSSKAIYLTFTAARVA